MYKRQSWTQGDAAAPVGGLAPGKVAVLRAEAGDVLDKTLRMQKELLDVTCSNTMDRQNSHDPRQEQHDSLTGSGVFLHETRELTKTALIIPKPYSVKPLHWRSSWH